MKKSFILGAVLMGLITGVNAQKDWDNVVITPSPGAGNNWILQNLLSDDFNYTGKQSTEFTNRWNDSYFNSWDGPGLTQWQSNMSDVKEGKLEIKAGRSNLFLRYTVGGVVGMYPKVDCGVVTGKQEVKYPVYVEMKMKVMNQTLSSNFWFLSRNDRQELDVIETYGSDRPDHVTQAAHMNSNWHIDVANGANWNAQADHYLPSGAPLRDEFHTYGMNWIDARSVDWYLDGVLVRKIRENSTDAVIDNRLFQYLNESMVMIIDVEDHDWRSSAGIISTDEELSDPTKNVMYVDWVRTYKPVQGVVGPVTGVKISRSTFTAGIGATYVLSAEVIPNNALDQTFTWKSDQSEVVSVDANTGKITLLKEGVAVITAVSNDGAKEDYCTVTVSGVHGPTKITLDDESKYTTTIFNDELVITTNFQVGIDNLVTDKYDGITYRLQRKTARGQVVEEVLQKTDPSVIGKQTGVSTVTMSLAGVPKTPDLAVGEYYSLYVIVNASNNANMDIKLNNIQIGGATSINSVVASIDEVYPNPTDGMLYVSTANMQAFSAVQAFNIAGQLVLNQELKASDSVAKLDVSNLPKGMYVLKLVGQSIQTSTFIKK